MEEAMLSFYNHSSVCFPLSKTVVGQLVAVREEDRDEVTRAQVIELISPDKAKVKLFRCLYPQVFVAFVFDREVNGERISF